MGIRLLVADHAIFVAGVRHFLADTEIELVSWAATGAQAVRLAVEEKPEVIMVSAQLADGDGIKVLERIRQFDPGMPVIMLAAYDHPPYMARVRAAGGFGCLVKDFKRDRLLEAIRRAAAGEQIWTREETRRIAGMLTTSALETVLDVALTPRETEVLRKVALGRTNRQIAEELGISHDTVKEHMQRVLNKVGVEDRTQAAVWAVRHGIA
ncbi:MAG: response regulator transcription factor [Pirellulales bacterium]|nr:response regulator transcription factor [Pirellulales bacterium]